MKNTDTSAATAAAERTTTRQTAAAIMEQAPNHEHQNAGICPVCHHYGDDCTGTMRNGVFPGLTFRTPSHECAWEVVYYHRGGNWVCQEPDHKTTCHFHESEILAGIVQPEPAPTATRHSLNGAAACQILSDIRAILYWTPGDLAGGDPGSFDPEKEWQAEHLEYVACTLENAGLAPTAPEPFRDITLADAAPEEPSALADHSAGAFLVTDAQDPLQTSEQLSAAACGAYSTCTTLEQFLSVQANYERAKEIRAGREVQP